MADEEVNANSMSSLRGGNPKFNDKKTKRQENRRKRRALEKTLKAEEEQAINKECTVEDQNPKSSDEMAENGTSSGRDKRQKSNGKNLLMELDGAEEEKEFDIIGPLEERNLNSNDGTAECGENKRKKQLLKYEKEQEMNGRSLLQEGSLKSNDDRRKIRKDKKQMQLSKKTSNIKDEEDQEVDRENLLDDGNPKSNNGSPEIGKESAKNEEKQEFGRMSPPGEGSPQSNSGKADGKKNKRKERLLKEAAKAENRGVCYLSRIPPQMDHVKLRQILSQYGQIQRIYLAPEDPATQVHRKRAGGFRGRVFSEGWVEFTKKGVAKRVANMLNGEQTGGRKRSSFYYDLWNIKYLSKFKWDDLTEEIAYKNAIREQKLPLVLSAAKRERDFYLSKVDQSRALSAIDERMKKKQKVQQGLGTNTELPVSQQKVIRKFPQTKPVGDDASQSKPKLSKDILAGIFGGS